MSDFSHQQSRGGWLGTVLGGLLLGMIGCGQPQSQNDQPSEPAPLSGVTLRLLVVDDPALATAVEGLRGEWKAQSGSELVVVQATEAELLSPSDGDQNTTDAVICASHLLGPLAEGERIVPLLRDQLHADDAQWATIFQLVRDHEAVWQTATFAVPLGSPVLVCYYRADLLAHLGEEPPTTWDEYQKLALLLADRSKLGPLAPPDNVPWAGTIEPLGPGWAAITFLARAVSAAKHPNNYSTLFDVETMEPLIGSKSKPMLDALVQLVDVAKRGPAEATTFGPEEVRNAFWQGGCGMALTWPSAAARLPETICKDLAVGLAELPGSKQVYDIDQHAWTTLPDDELSRVPLLAIAGRLGVVPTAAARPDAATALLAWLSSSDLGSPPSARSPATTLFRQPHLKKPQNWVEAPMPPAVVAAYADLTAATLGREQAVAALRIPGRAEYLAALDDAVRAAIGAQKSPKAALDEAAQRWAEITNKYGKEQQRLAYLHSLGLEP